MSGSGISTPQQPTNECIAACIRLCNAECTHDRQKPRPFASEPIPAQLSPTPVPDQFASLMSLQPSTTECLPPMSETECACPGGFTVCVAASGSNQCCRIR
uniref:WAP domain-containing protein n=1 Tax=Ascaris lumbricoides TaxID=6252 RepID=A0A0M3IVH6_ASCLU